MKTYQDTFSCILKLHVYNINLFGYRNKEHIDFTSHIDRFYNNDITHLKRADLARIINASPVIKADH